MAMAEFSDYINGVDVSSIQGDINWHKMADYGYEFAYIRSSLYSRIRDDSFFKNAMNAKRAGLLVGAYHVCSVAHGPGNMTDPAEQMKFFHTTCEGWGGTGELPPMLDWEVNTVNAPELAVGWLLRALEVATELWYPHNAKRVLDGFKPRYPVVYTYHVFAQAHQPFLLLSPELKKHPLCFANYKYEKKDWHPCLEGRTEPFLPVPKPWDKALLWQHTGNGGAVPGVTGWCDKQVFLGSSGELAEFAGIDRPVSRSEWKDK